MNLSFLVMCVALLSATGCSANRGVRTGKAAASQTVSVQPWLVGLSAVVGFLFIAFTILILHRLFRKSRDDEEKWGFENKAIDMDGEHNKQTTL